MRGAEGGRLVKVGLKGKNAVGQWIGSVGSANKKKLNLDGGKTLCSHSWRLSVEVVSLGRCGFMGKTERKTGGKYKWKSPFV